jgi:error-prone DNA polymerase
MGFKRSIERMAGRSSRGACASRGCASAASPGEAEEQIVRADPIGFALYGFPESHAASFALIAYASGWLKRCHHPAAFLVGLLRSQPMGFYSPATLVKDAQRHGVEVRPVDVVFSRVQSDLEPGRRGAGQAGDARATPPPAVRIGLDAVGGASRKTAARIVAERERRAFEDLGDFVRRVGPDQDELEALAELGALASLPGAARERRGTLWQVAALERDPRSLFAGRAIARPAAGRAREDRDDGDAPDGIAPDEIDSPLRPLSALEETLADYRLSGLTTGAHVLAHLRPRLERAGLLPAPRSSARCPTAPTSARRATPSCASDPARRRASAS